jgi:hypothetical protein
VRDAGRLDRADLLKLDLGAPEVVKEASAVPEQYRNDVELERREGIRRRWRGRLARSARTPARSRQRRLPSGSSA